MPARGYRRRRKAPTANVAVAMPTCPPMPLWRTLASAAVIVLLGVVCYRNTLDVPEVLDDSASISENTYIRQLWPITRAMQAPPQQTTAGRPILALSLAVNYAISGTEMWSYHVFNTAAHVLAGLTLMGIVRRTLHTPRLARRFGTWASWLALVCAAIWVAHPLQTAAVTYTIQRGESMMGLFYLLTLYCSIRSYYSRRRAAWYAAAMTVCALGMGTKEVMATAPLMVAMYDRVFLFRSLRETLKARAGLYCALAATWAILLALVAGGPRSRSAGMGLAVTPLRYAQAQCGVIMHYIRLAFWPHPLVLDYAWRMPPGLAAVAVPAAGLAALLAATVLALRYRPDAGFLGAWFFLILGPTSSFIPIADLAFEHRMYLSLAAVVAGVVLTAAWMLGRLRAHPRVAAAAGLALAAAVVALLAWGTRQRNEVFRDPRAIWEDTVRHAPHNARAHNNLGYAERRTGPEYIEGAIEEYNKAIELDPKYVQAYSNRGVAYGYLGENDKALADFNAAIKLSPGSARPYYNRAVISLLEERYRDAEDDLTTALRLEPNYALVYTRRGEVRFRLGKLDEAMADYDMALRLMPDLAQARELRQQALESRNGPKRAN